MPFDRAHAASGAAAHPWLFGGQLSELSHSLKLRLHNEILGTLYCGRLAVLPGEFSPERPGAWRQLVGASDGGKHERFGPQYTWLLVRDDHPRPCGAPHTGSGNGPLWRANRNS